MNRWPRLTSSVLPLLAACLFLILWLGSRKQEHMMESELTQLRKAHLEVVSRLQVEEDQNTTLRKQLEANGVHPAVPPPTHGASASSILEAVRKLALTQRELTDAKAQLTALQQKELQLEYNLGQLQSDNQRLTAAATEARDEADSAKRLNDAIEA